MPFSFPASPAIGATSTQNGREYRYAGNNAWELVGSGEDALLRSIFVPAAPTGLTATAGDASATLAWTAPTGVIAQAPITGYRVEYTPSGGSPTVVSTGSTATSYTLSSLTNGTAYTARVAAVNAVGVGAYTAASAAVTPSAVTPDPFFGNVALLLHMDGNGDAFVDSSPSQKSVTASPNATQSAAQNKWGGKSAAFGGGNGHLSIPSSADLSFSTGAFTIECWIYTAFAGGQTIYGRCSPGNQSAREMAIQLPNASTLRFYHGQRGSTETIRNFAAPAALTPNQWHHVAVTRDGTGVCRAFFNGAASADTYTDSVNLDNDFPAFVGSFVLGNDHYDPFYGYIDDLRITKGIARSITQSPTAPFPDVGPMSAPTSLTATAGNAQVSLAWTAPSYNGGSAITGYSVEYTPSGGSPTVVSTGSTSTSYTLTGLTNGTAYTVRVAGVNANGTGTYTAASSSVTPSAVTLSTPYGAVTGSGTVGSKWAWQSGSGFSSGTSAKLLTATGSVTLQATLANTGGGNCDGGEFRSLGIYSAANVRVRTMSSNYGGDTAVPESLTAGQYIQMELDCSHARAEVWVV